MQAAVQKFTEFIAGDVTMIIPVYQRNYDWRRKDCERLFNDISNIVERDKPHFIGTFVYRKNPNGNIFTDYIIIDGQQRITSIILLVRALYELVDDRLKAEINAKFLRHPFGGDMANKCRLRSTEFDRATFEKLMDGADNFTADEKSSALYENYHFFREKIPASKIDPQKLYYALHNLKVVSISLDDENPQEIFESLNSTGQALTQADLIRNFLLMPLEYAQQERLYKNYWLAIEELLRPSDNVENFIVQYLIACRKSDSTEGKKKSSKVFFYDTFKDFFAKNYSDAELCLKDMLRYAKFFRRVIFNADTAFANLSALDKKFYELTSLLEAKNAPIILMYLLDRCEKNHFDEAAFIGFVDALISLAFRAKVCKRNGIDQQFAGNVLARLDKENPLDADAFWTALTFGNGDRAFPNDNDFQAALANADLQDRIKNDGFKYLLYSLERHLDAQNLPAYSEVTVEKILPENPNADWKRYLAARNDSQTYKPWIKSLGNQTLVNSADRGRKDLFDKKKSRYAQSCLSCTRALSSYSHWTSKQIQARAKKLAEAAVKVWTLPEKFNATIKNASDIFNLDSDFNALTGTKPATLSICKNAMEISSWRTVLHEVAQQLYMKDKDLFKKAARMENVPRSGKFFVSKPTKFPLDKDYYIYMDFDALTCLKITKALAENFERVGNTNVKDEIWFTLRRE